MRSMREPLFQAQLDPGTKSPLWLFAVEIMVSNFHSHQKKSVKNRKRRISLICSGQPYIDSNNGPMSPCYQIILASLQTLAGLLLYVHQKKSPMVEQAQSDESRASIAYLLFVQHIGIDHFPSVFR